MIKVRGGKREGAGRPAVGVTKKVSITLPEEVWEKIKIEKSRKKCKSVITFAFYH